jgi:hypothetical protein
MNDPLLRARPEGALKTGRARMRGAGPYAAALHRLFEQSAARHGLRTERSPEPPTTFRRPPKRSAQLSLLP